MASRHHSGLRFYRGWMVLAGAFIAHLAAAGSVHVAFGLFVVPASAELDISRADANTFLIAVGIGSALIAPFAGRLLDRVSARLVMAVGGLLLAACFAGLSATTSTTIMLMIALVPLAFASDCAGGMAANTLTVRWFRRRRGRALAIVAMAVSAGNVILPPVVGYLIVAHGWRSAVGLLGIAAGAVIFFAAVALIRVRPTDEELVAAGEEKPDADEEARQLEKRLWSYRELLTNRNFLFLVVGSGILVACDRALLISVAPYYVDAGYGVQDAAVVLSVLGGSAVAGKLLVGYLADIIDPRKIFAVVAALHIALLILFINQPSYTVMLAGAATFGVGIGGVLPAWQVLMASTFGSASYGTVLGTSSVILQVLMMTALRFIGEVRDRTGSYELGFEIFIVLAVLSAILVWQVRPNPPREAGAPAFAAETP